MTVPALGEPFGSQEGHWGGIVSAIYTRLVPRLIQHGCDLFVNTHRVAQTTTQEKKRRAVLSDRTLGPSFLFVLQGSLTICGRDGTFIVDSGFGYYSGERTNLTIERGWWVHSSKWLRMVVEREGVSVRMLAFTAEGISSGPPYLVSDRVPMRLYRWWTDEVADRGPGSLSCRVLLTAFFLALARSTPRLVFDPPPSLVPAEVDDPRVAKALNVIHQSFHQKLRLSAVARQCGMSPEHLCRVFRASVGMTPWQYLLRLRLETARQILMRTNWRVREVARHVGFGDLRHFQRVFRRAYGVPPDTYRTRSR